MLEGEPGNKARTTGLEDQDGWVSCSLYRRVIIAGVKE